MALTPEQEQILAQKKEMVQSLENELGMAEPQQITNPTPEDVSKGFNDAMQNTSVEDQTSYWDYTKDIGRGIATGMSNAFEESLQFIGNRDVFNRHFGLPVEGDIQKVLNKNADKNFVQRIINKDQYPVITNQDGSVSTHKMAYSENQNGTEFYVYPTIIQDANTGDLLQLTDKEAYDYAMNTGEFITFNNKNEADSFSQHYKVVWDKPAFDLQNVDVPDMGDAQTIPGSLAQGISQFLTGFVGTGKLTLLNKFKPLTNLARFGKATTQGAIADVMVFDANAGRLTDLIKEHTDIQGPIVDFLATNKDDTEMEGRLKNALEGAGLGAAVEGFVSTLRVMKRGYNVWKDSSALRDKYIKTNIEGSPELQILDGAISKARAYDTVYRQIDAAETQFRDHAKDLQLLRDMVSKNKVTDYVKGKSNINIDTVNEAIALNEKKLKRYQEGSAQYESITGYIDFLNTIKTDLTDLHNHNFEQVVARSAKGVQQEDPIPVGDFTSKSLYVDQGKASAFAEAVVKGDVNGVVDNAGFNFNTIESNVDIQQMIADTASFFQKETTDKTRGTVSFAQTMDGVNSRLDSWLPEHLVQLQHDTSRLDERFLANKAVWLASTRYATDLAKQAAAGDKNALEALKKHMIVHAAVQANVKGAQTEIARALSAMRNTIGNQGDKAVSKLLTDVKENIDETFAQMLSDVADNPAAVQGLADNVIKNGSNRSARVFEEIWKAGLLSGTGTHFVNTVGNAVAFVNTIPENILTDLIGTVRGTPGATLDMRAQFFGMWQGLQDAFGLNTRLKDGTVYRAWKDERTYGGMGTQQTEINTHAISSEYLGIDPNSSWGKSVDAFGKTVRVPFRALGAMDTFFKTMHSRTFLNSAAYRQAINEGKTGQDLVNRVTEILQAPDGALLEKAAQYADYHTFTNPMGPLGRKTDAVRRELGTVGQLVIPFMKTPTNLIKYPLHRLPIPKTKAWNDLKAGGAVADNAMARITLGLSAVAYAMSLHRDGKITGRFSQDERHARLLNGEKEYSFVMTDNEGKKHYIEYKRLAPFSTLLGTAADIDKLWTTSETESDVGLFTDTIGAATIAFGNNIVDQTWFTNLDNLVNVFTGTFNNEERSGEEVEKYFAKLTGSLIPNIAKQFEKETTDEMREAESFSDYMLMYVPGYHETMPIRYNNLGQKTYADIGWDGIRTSEEGNTISQEVSRLRIEAIANPAKFKTLGQGYELNAEQRNMWRKKMGEPLKMLGGITLDEMLTSIIQSPGYQSLPDGNESAPGTKAFILKRYYLNAYEATKQEMIYELNARPTMIENRRKKRAPYLYGGQ